MELWLPAVYKTQNEKKIGQYPAILTVNWSITRTECGREWVRINLLKTMALQSTYKWGHSLWMISYITNRCIFICVWIWTNTQVKNNIFKWQYFCQKKRKNTTTTTIIISQLWMWSFILSPISLSVWIIQRINVITSKFLFRICMAETCTFSELESLLYWHSATAPFKFHSSLFRQLRYLNLHLAP